MDHDPPHPRSGRCCQVTIAPDDTELARVRSFVEDSCVAAGTDADACQRLVLAADEVCSNIIAHGGSPAPIRLRLSRCDTATCLEVTDDARPFDPRSIAPVDVTRGATRPIGGLGWHLVTHAVDGVDYRRRDGRNVLTLTVNDDAPCRTTATRRRP